MPKKFPKFKTEAEEIKFWETHSIADYWDELEEGWEVYDFKKSDLGYFLLMGKRGYFCSRME